jgi:hypothetical protein
MLYYGSAGGHCMRYPKLMVASFFYNSPRAFYWFDEIAHVDASYLVHMLFFVSHDSVGSHCR